MKIITTKQYKMAQSQVGMDEVYNFDEGKNRASQMSIEELMYALDDLRKVIKVQEAARKEGHYMKKLNYYWDEYWTYSDELKKRQTLEKTNPRANSENNNIETIS